MAFSAATSRAVELNEAESPLMNGTGHVGDKAVPEEEDIDEIRRYEDFSTVDWIEDSLHERDARVKAPPDPNSFTYRMNHLEGAVGLAWRALSHALEEGQGWVVISLVGVAIGMSAAVISITTAWLSDIKMGYCTTGWWLSQKFCCLELSDEGMGCAEWTNWGGVEPFRWIAYIAFAALLSFSAAYLVKSFAPYAAGSGISEIKCILGGFIIKRFLGLETLVIKSLALPLAIASGLSVGKEGPSVHVACSIGNVIGRSFSRYDRSQLKMREILTASSAAGVAVAFGSPIGGVLFSIEEMNQTFTNKTMWRSFVCALVATFTLSAMNPFRTGKLVLFQVSYDRDWHYFEIPAYIIIGIFGGLYGAFVIKFNTQVATFRRKHLASHGVSEAVLLATITAFVGYLNRFLRIDMTESMEILFKECEGGGDHAGLCQTSSQWQMVNTLLLATIVRTALIVISYGCKVPAGIFVPSMAVGATFGRMIGILAKALHAAYPGATWFAVCQPDAPCITPGTYAFLGAAAALGGITRLTVTVVVIMFELTGALTYILPTMIVLLVTKAVSDQFGGGGIADQMIKFNGYPFLEKEDKEDGDHAFVEPIGKVMRKDIIVMTASGMPLPVISEIVQSTTYQGFPVVRSANDRTVIGFIRKNELRFALERARRNRYLSPNAICSFEATGDMSRNSGMLPHRDIVIPGRRVSSTFATPNLRNAETMPGTQGVEGMSDRVDFGQYVDETPLTVSPKLPLEIVMQLFRRMGPRVILVAHQGQLKGLVTVKDVLRHEARYEAYLHRSASTPLTGGLHSLEAGSTPDSPRFRPPGIGEHVRRDSIGSAGSGSSWTGWQESWAPVVEGDDGARNGQGLEIALEEAYGWLQIRGNRIYNLVNSSLGRLGLIKHESIARGGGENGRGEGDHAAFEYELSDDIRPAG